MCKLQKFPKQEENSEHRKHSNQLFAKTSGDWFENTQLFLEDVHPVYKGSSIRKINHTLDFLTDKNTKK